MNSQRLSEFEEYFQINESIRVNLFAVENQLVPQSQLALEDDIPPLFKLANEVSELEQASLRPLRNLGDLAQELASMPAVAVRSMLGVLVNSADRSLADLLKAEREAVHATRGTSDSKEGMMAFLEKRKPVFNRSI